MKTPAYSLRASRAASTALSSAWDEKGDAVIRCAAVWPADLRSSSALGTAAGASSARWARLLVSRSTSPTRASARAIARPVLPLKMLPQSRTASIRSRVLPAVTRNRLLLLPAGVLIGAPGRHHRGGEPRMPRAGRVGGRAGGVPPAPGGGGPASGQIF